MAKKNDGVKVLKGLEGVRHRYGMYAGSQPVQHMIKEAIDNCCDEYFKGICDKIIITVDTKKNYMKVEDNGSGLPNSWNETEKMYNIELLTMKLHAGTKFDDDDGLQRSGMNGVGIKIISALSKWGKTTSERNGERRCIEFSKGKKVGEVKQLKAKGKSGTISEFIPDDELLGDKAIIDVDKLKENLQLRCYLNSGLRLNLIVDGKEFEYYSENGSESYINDTVDKPLFGLTPIILKKEIDGNYYEIAMSYQNSTDENILGFANSVILDRGTHETAVKTVLTRIFTNYIKDKELLSKKDSNLTIKGDDIRKGLVCLVNMRIKKAEYSSQTKNELSNKEVITHITALFNEQFMSWIAENEQTMKKLCQRIIQFAKATENIKKQQDKIIKGSSTSLMTLSDKFIDCVTDDPDKAEIFLCEGKSAGGSIKRGRDAEFQAIYMLRGKILNTVGSSAKTIMCNQEISEMVQILFGVNNFKDIDIEKIKFKKIIILADSE